MILKGINENLIQLYSNKNKYSYKYIHIKIDLSLSLSLSLSLTMSNLCHIVFIRFPLQLDNTVYINIYEISKSSTHILYISDDCQISNGVNMNGDS